MNTRNTRLLTAAGLTAFLIFLLAADFTSGSVSVSLGQAVRLLFMPDNGSPEWMTIHHFRLPRVITALLAGIALSVSGLQMQTVFRNPLAGPYVLGISAGSGLGVALVVIGFGGALALPRFEVAGNWIIVLAAWFGAALVLGIILVLSLRVRDVMTILIIGMMLGSGISAIISILQYFSQESALKAFVIWTMGSVSNVGKDQLPYLLAGFIPGILLSFFILKPSDAVLTGENNAKTLGVNISAYRTAVFAATCLLTGTITAFCGPIGFVGIAVPHIARMVTGSALSKPLFLFSCLIGGILLLLSDLITQFPPRDLVLPLNAVTSVIGIPVVIFVVLRKRNMLM